MASFFACLPVWPRAAVRLVQRLSAVCLFTAHLGSSASFEEPGPSLNSDQSFEFCQRPEPGSLIPEPHELRSHDGVLNVDLTIRNQKRPDGSTRYCYLTPDGELSPTLRLKPGELLILHFINKLADLGSDVSTAGHMYDQPEAPPEGPVSTSQKRSEPCTSGALTPLSANIHFHGLAVPPACHQDDVIGPSIQPDDPPFEYRFRIPDNAPPGLYWYHPQVNGFSKVQILGGASGALVVEGIEQANPALAGLPERVLVIRDQDLLSPYAAPSNSEPLVPKTQLDSDGDTTNSGTGFGKPTKDLSVNFVPVPYPDYPPAKITMKPGERQLWRVLNASAITYLNLAVLFGRTPQMLGVVAIDGVPIRFNGSPAPPVAPVNHIGVPPGARVEFIVDGPPLGVPALLVTRAVDTGPAGENDPNRALASIGTVADAPEPQAKLPADPEPLLQATASWVGRVAPVRVRRLFFFDQPIVSDFFASDATNPKSLRNFYITVDGKTPVPFDPRSDVPEIVVKQGDVEDWIIENRSMELHDFHIHQVHFQLREWSGLQVNEPFLRDTVNVPYYNGRTLRYPSLRLRMDFRDPSIVGTFFYHCHLLGHEDGGMVGRIKVEPAGATTSNESSNQLIRGEAHDP
jgi:FtsP/CotA-like multicopper oxidase with cupredoxin domain